MDNKPNHIKETEFEMINIAIDFYYFTETLHDTRPISSTGCPQKSVLKLFRNKMK